MFQRVTCHLRTAVTPLLRSNMKKTTHVSPSFRKIHMVWPPSVGSLKILLCLCKRALYFRSTTHDLRKRDMYYLKKRFLILHYMVWPRSPGSLQDQGLLRPTFSFLFNSTRQLSMSATETNQRWGGKIRSLSSLPKSIAFLQKSSGCPQKRPIK